MTLGAEDLRRMFLSELKGPALLLSLYYEHYEEWAQSVMDARSRHETDELIIGPLIDTSLGVSSRRAYLLETDPATEFLGQWDFKSYMATADVWPTTDVGDEFRQEVVSQIPVVFVEGDWDTSTPIENTLSVAPFFRNGHVLIVEHGRHAAMKKIEDAAPEVFKALLEFVRTGVADKIPNRISLPVPVFDPPTFPPPRSTQEWLSRKSTERMSRAKVQSAAAFPGFFCVFAPPREKYSLPQTRLVVSGKAPRSESGD